MWTYVSLMRTIRGGRHGTVAVVIIDAVDLSISGIVVVAIVVVVVIVRISISPCSQLPEASQPPSPLPPPKPSSPLFLISFPSLPTVVLFARIFLFLTMSLSFYCCYTPTPIHVHLLLRVNESRVHPGSNTTLHLHGYDTPYTFIYTRIYTRNTHIYHVYITQPM